MNEARRMSTTSPTGQRQSRWWLPLAVFIVLVVGVGVAIGILSAPGDWYAGLEKPAFNPPSWIFAPVWTLLYIMIGVAGWRIWRIAPRSAAMKFWIAQMVLNWLWSPVFFGAHRPWMGLFVIVALLCAIAAFIVQARKRDMIASLLFVPYALWVAFATLLNLSLAVLN